MMSGMTEPTAERTRVERFDHRVIHTVKPPFMGQANETWDIHEVFYDAYDKIVAWSETASTPFSDESEEDLKDDVFLIMSAFTKPTLERKDLEGLPDA